MITKISVQHFRAITLIVLLPFKVAVNSFNFSLLQDRKESVQFMSDSLQIRTGRWHFTNVNDIRRPVCLSPKFLSHI